MTKRCYAGKEQRWRRLGGEVICPPDVQMEADVTFNLEFVPSWLKNTVVSAVVVFEQLNVQEPDRIIQEKGRVALGCNIPKWKQIVGGFSEL